MTREMDFPEGEIKYTFIPFPLLSWSNIAPRQEREMFLPDGGFSHHAFEKREKNPGSVQFAEETL